MSKNTRAKMPVANKMAQNSWTLQSRPFVDETQMRQQPARSSAVHGLGSRPPTRCLVDEPLPESVPLVLQPRLNLGRVNDAYEREADTVAEHVVTRTSGTASELPPPLPKIQRLATVGGTAEVSPKIAAGIEEARRSGQPLATSIRGSMERAFGADFSGVRVHADAQSDQLNQSLRATAFTTGQDIFFRHGTYEPGIRTGQGLLAHELTHIVQQSNNRLSRSNHQYGRDKASCLIQTMNNDGFSSQGKKKGTTIGSSYGFVPSSASFVRNHLANNRADAIRISQARKSHTADLGRTKVNTVLMHDEVEIQDLVSKVEYADTDPYDGPVRLVPIVCDYIRVKCAVGVNSLTFREATEGNGTVRIKAYFDKQFGQRGTISLTGIAGEDG